MELFGTILIAILIFGFLIFIHELGHYIFARIFNVTVLEFSIGMGPKILSYTSKKTNITYAISAIPIGGYVAMAGEDGESDDPNSFDKKPAWQRLIITVAGATINIVAGFILMIVYTLMVNIGGTTIYDFRPVEDTGYTVSTSDYLEAGDTIIAVNGKSVGIADELSYEIMRYGNEPVDLTVVRDGKQITLEDVIFPTLESQGQVFGVMDFIIYATEKNFGSVLEYSMRKGVLMMRMCWESVYDLIVGRYTLEAVSGPIGISSAIGEAASVGIEPLIYLSALITINLGIMNLLPIPALDGGRTLTILIEMITRKRMPPKVENTINAVGLALLLGLSVLVMIKDVIGLFV